MTPYDMFRDPKVIFREFGIQMKSEDIKNILRVWRGE